MKVLMIKNIIEIKNYGIFKDFTPGAALNFPKFNLVYGWNASGKSILSKVFYSISSKTKHSNFPDGKFKISILGGGAEASEDDSDQYLKFEKADKISDENVKDNSLNLRVFNGDFIQKNVKFEDQKANSILVISEEKIEEVKKLKELTIRKKSG